MKLTKSTLEDVKRTKQRLRSAVDQARGNCIIFLEWKDDDYAKHRRSALRTAQAMLEYTPLFAPAAEKAQLPDPKCDPELLRKAELQCQSRFEELKAADANGDHALFVKLLTRYQKDTVVLTRTLTKLQSFMVDPLADKESEVDCKRVLRFLADSVKLKEGKATKLKEGGSLAEKYGLTECLAQKILKKYSPGSL